MRNEVTLKQPRCHWCLHDPLNIAYHDQEWGVPLFDEHALFEFLILEGMQAGLSWITILRKRDALRQAFANFDPLILAQLSDNDLLQLLNNPQIIRNRLKVAAVRSNALAFLNLADHGLNFSNLIWKFTDGKAIHNHWKTLQQVPASTPLSVAMSRELKQRSFKFVGVTICYAFMQAVGMVNDHMVDCFRHPQLQSFVSNNGAVRPENL